MVLKWDENLQKRVVSAAILVPIVLLITWVGDMLFNALLLAAAVVMAFEWCYITHNKEDLDEKQKQRWMIGGIIYIVLSVVSVMYLRYLENGFSVVLVLLLLIWTIDICAYMAGRAIGGPKIWPAISPNKTWAGLVGAMLGAAIVNMIVGLFFGSPLFLLALMGMVLAVISQVGDFFESWIKRQFDVKDSGALIPGHGGIMDRVDGLTFAAPVIALMAWLNHGAVPLWS